MTDKLKLMGYYGNYETYGRDYQPENIDFGLVDEVLYAFVQVGNCLPDFSAVAADWSAYNRTIASIECRGGDYATANKTTIEKAEIFSTDPYSDFYKWGNEYKTPNPIDSWWNGKGNMAKIIKYAHNENAIALLSIGGWSSSISLLWAINNKQDELVDNILKFINEDLTKKYFQYDTHKEKPIVPDKGFDGVDIDLEPYANHWDKMSQDEIKNFVNFINLLKNKLGDDKILSIAISGSPITPKSINYVPGNMKSIADNIDKLFIMSYDYHGAFDKPAVTNFHSPLFFDLNQPKGVAGREIFNTHTGIKAYVDAGVPESKIVLGYPSYGRGVGSVDGKLSTGENIKGLYQNFSSVPVGQYDNTGVWDYIGIKNTLITQKGYKESFSKKAGSASAYSAEEKAFISYDNPESVALKTCYAKTAGLQGVFTWTFAGDKEKDLINAAHSVITNGCSEESNNTLAAVYGHYGNSGTGTAGEIGSSDNTTSEAGWFQWEYEHPMTTLLLFSGTMILSIITMNLVSNFIKSYTEHEHLD